MSRRTTTAPARRAAAVALGVTALLGAACGGTSLGATAQASVTSHLPHTGHETGTSSKLDEAATAAAAAYSGQIASSAAIFLAGVDGLYRAVKNGDLAAARADELSAQASYDSFRVVEGANPINAATVDELETEVVPGTSFAGLHAVEADLWSGRPAGQDAESLLPQASVARNLVTRTRLSPEAIGLVAEEELSWVVDIALPYSQEPMSHLGLVDVAATVGAARNAYDTISPLAQLVAPTLATAIAAQFDALAAQIADLGPPTTTPDTSLPRGPRLAASVRLNATASLLAQLTTHLAPFGTRGAPA